jgi:hypothetical protein
MVEMAEKATKTGATDSATPDQERPDYDLTCWYLNIRRVMELVGTKSVATDLRNLDALGKLNDHLRKIGLLASLKDALTRWLHEHNPPTLGKLIIEEKLRPGELFTHYDRYFCKGLSGRNAAVKAGGTPAQPAEAYAKLDSFRPGLKLSVRFHSEHLTSDSSWHELSGQSRLLVLGAATEVRDGLIEAIPWIIANPLHGLPQRYSVIGSHWFNRLEVHVDSIDSFSRVRDVRPPPSKEGLEALRNLPERDVKQAFAEIISEPHVPPDWGGEQSDLFSTQVMLDGERIATAFAFKGPAKFHPMTMADLGKNGDQINRLFAEPARLLVLQHCHQITPPVRDTMRAFAQQMGNPRLFCLINGFDTLRVLRAYGKCGFAATAP